MQGVIFAAAAAQLWPCPLAQNTSFRVSGGCISSLPIGQSTPSMACATPLQALALACTTKPPLNFIKVLLTSAGTILASTVLSILP